MLKRQESLTRKPIGIRRNWYLLFSVNFVNKVDRGVFSLDTISVKLLNLALDDAINAHPPALLQSPKMLIGGNVAVFVQVY